MPSATHLRLVYSSSRTVTVTPTPSLRERVQRGIDNTPFTYGAISTCTLLAVASIERLRGETPPSLDSAWSQMNDKALLATMPITFPLCVMSDMAAMASYPLRLWQATRPID